MKVYIARTVNWNLSSDDHEPDATWMPSRAFLKLSDLAKVVRDSMHDEWKDTLEAEKDSSDFAEIEANANESLAQIDAVFTAKSLRAMFKSLKKGQDREIAIDIEAFNCCDDNLLIVSEVEVV